MTYSRDPQGVADWAGRKAELDVRLMYWQEQVALAENAAAKAREYVVMVRKLIDAHGKLRPAV